MPSSTQASTVSRSACTPARCPSTRGSNRRVAQRPLPSMMTATWTGSRLRSMSCSSCSSADAAPPATGSRPLACGGIFIVSVTPRCMRLVPRFQVPRRARRRAPHPAFGARRATKRRTSRTTAVHKARRGRAIPPPRAFGEPLPAARPTRRVGCSNFQDLLFLGGQQLVDLLNILVRQLLHIRLRPVRLVLGDNAFFLQALQLVVGVAPHVANGDPRLFRFLAGQPRQ